MNMLAPLRKPKRKPPINLDAFIDEQLGNLVLTDTDTIEDVPLPTPVELAEQRVNQFIADEEAQIAAIQRRIELRDEDNRRDREEITQRKAAIAIYRGDQIKPKGKAAK